MDDDLPQVWICQGPPLCQLQDDDAMRAMKEGCPWCKVSEYDPVKDCWTVIQNISSA